MLKNNPFNVLGLKPGKYSDTELKKKYLELIKKYTPEKRPDKFEEVRTAYTTISNAKSIYDVMALTPFKLCDETIDEKELIKEMENRLGISKARTETKKTDLLNRLEEIIKW